MKNPAKGKFFLSEKKIISKRNFSSFFPNTTSFVICLLLFVVLGSVSIASPLFLPFFTKANKTPEASSRSKSVLAASTGKSTGKISFNLSSFFKDDVTFKKYITVDGEATFNGKAIFNNDVQMTNHNLDLGTGSLTAANVLYGLTAGEGITISQGQTPTITNTGVLSLQGQKGAVTFEEGTGITFDGLKINNTGVTAVQGQTGAVTFTAGNGISVDGTTISQTLASNLTTNGVLYAKSASTLTSLVPGTTGYILQSNGTDAPPSWIAQNSGNVTFTNITSGTNTTAAMIVGSGASLTFSGTGTINSSTLNGNTFAAPSAIGSTTPSTGAFTTLTISTLGTGIGHLNSSGVLTSSAVALGGTDVTGTLPVGNGGTGVTNVADGSLLYGSGGTTMNAVAIGANNFCLTSNGSAPIWTSCSGSGTNYLQKNTDSGSGLSVLAPATIADTLAIGITNPLDFSGLEVDQNAKGNAVAVINQTGSGDIFTASASGTPKFTIANNGAITASNYGTGIGHFNSSGVLTSSAVNLAGGSSEITGTLPVGNGGTGATTFTSNGIIYGNTASALQVTAAGTTGTVLHGNTGSAPTFSAISLTADVSGILPLANGGSNANLTAVNGGIVYSGASAMALSAAGTTGQALISGGAGTPTWFAPTAGSILFAGTSGILSQNNSNFFWDNTNTRLGLGVNSSLLGTLDVRTTSGTLPVATISGKTSFAGLVVDNSGLGNIFTASSSGMSRFTIQQNGTIVVGSDTGTPVATTIRGGVASGSNIAGANLTIDASNGTGDGGSGDLIFRTAPITGGITLDTTSAGNQDNFNNTLSWSHTTTSSNNRILFVSTNESNSSSVTGITYGASSMTNVNSVTCGNSNCKNELWYLVAPATGTNTITITYNGSTNHRVGGAATFYNVDQSTPLGTSATNSNSSTTASVTVSNTTAQQIVVDSLAANSSTWTADSTQAQLWNQNNATLGISAGSYKTGSATSTTMQWTNTSDSWGSIGVPVNAAANSSVDTLTDRLHITATGNVGVGISTPAFKLDIQDSQSATVAAQIFNTNTGTNADGLIVKLGNTSTTVASTTNHFVNFETSGIGVVGSIQGNGGKNVNYVTNGIADFAEYMKKDPNETIPWGAILCLGNDGYVHPCSNNNNNIVGVASEFPTFTGGENLGNGSITVGLSGVVNTLVTTSNGIIASGNIITSSAVAGVGIKATNKGEIVGKAIENFDGTKNTISCPAPIENLSCGKILVLVNPNWADPAVQLTNSGNITIPSPAIATEQIVLGSNATATPTTTITELQTQYASLSAKIIKLDQMDDLSQRITALEKNLPLFSASASGNLATGDATISGQLAVTGKTLLGDIGITGKVSMGLLTIDGMGNDSASPAAEINTLSGPLKLQPLALNGIDFENGKVTIDTEGNIIAKGNITAKTVHADKYEATDTGTGASTGEATIPAGETSIDIKTTAITDNSHIFTSPDQILIFPLGIPKKQAGVSFTVGIPKADKKDIKFSWWVLN